MPKVGKKQPKPKQPDIDLTCASCGKMLKSSNFYVSYNKIHTTGKIPYCMTCIKEMCLENGKITIDNVKKMLSLIDRPFIYDLFIRSCEDKVESIGCYMKNIAMPQFRALTWKDSAFESKAQEIINTEKIYSKQWLGDYTIADIEYMDNYLKGLHSDFKITTENHKDYAKKIAKASLHMDKCFQEMLQGDGADKRYKDARESFDTLSKSAQFSENTRGINDVSLGGFGVVFDKVEQKVWIPKHTPLEKDDIDKLIDYFGTIFKSV